VVFEFEFGKNFSLFYFLKMHSSLLISLRKSHIIYLIMNDKCHQIIGLKFLSIPCKETYHNRKTPQVPKKDGLPPVVGPVSLPRRAHQTVENPASREASTGAHPARET